MNEFQQKLLKRLVLAQAAVIDWQEEEVSAFPSPSLKELEEHLREALKLARAAQKWDEAAR